MMNRGLLHTKMFRVSRATHKYKIPCVGSSTQMDGLEAGSITYEDSRLIRSVLVVRKFVKKTLVHQIRILLRKS